MMHIVNWAKDKIHKGNNTDSSIYDDCDNGRMVKIVTFLLFLNLVLNLNAKSWSLTVCNVQIDLAPKDAIPNGVTIKLVSSGFFEIGNFVSTSLALLTGILSAEINIKTIG